MTYFRLLFRFGNIEFTRMNFNLIDKKTQGTLFFESIGLLRFSNVKRQKKKANNCPPINDQKI